MEESGLRWLLGQGVGLVALALCLVAFASKRDDRLFVLLLFANVAFAAQFALFESWVAAGISALIVLRIAESLILLTNVITMLRLRRDARLRYFHG